MEWGNIYSMGERDGPMKNDIRDVAPLKKATSEMYVAPLKKTTSEMYVAPLIGPMKNDIRDVCSTADWINEKQYQRCM